MLYWWMRTWDYNMPTITVNRKVFESLVGKKLSTDELKERISYLGTDLEDVTDTEITAEIFPNRPDLLSVQGFARAFASFIGSKPGLRAYKVVPSGEEVIIDKSVKSVRPYTACAIVKGIKFDDERIKEIIMIQEKLHVTYGRNRRKVAIGVYPFERIKPPIRFLARKPEDIKFQPLESPKVMNGRQILSQHPTGREYAHLLEGCELFPLFMDADDQILSMPPIINSHTTGKITEASTDVFIECSGFDFPVLEKCLNMIVTAMADMGGTVCSMKLRYPDKTLVTPNLSPWSMKLDSKYINRLLGLELSSKEIKDCLMRMGYGVKEGSALIPAYRADILHQVDLAEDVAIAYGYENFEALIPNVATVGQEDELEIQKRKIAYILAGLGLFEVNTTNLSNKRVQAEMMNASVDTIELANSLSQEFNVLRAWVTPSMLEVLKANKHHEYPQRIFGIGTVFRKNVQMETNVEEHERLSVALCSDTAGYTEIKQVLDYLLSQLDISYTIKETEHPSFIPGRVGRVSVAGKNIAYIGELAPVVLDSFGLEMPVAAFELNLSEMFGLGG
jgi:phenylalanyl-tRNA synthetase beta chain